MVFVQVGQNPSNLGGPHHEWTFDGFVVAPKCRYVNYLHIPQTTDFFPLFFFIIIS